MKDNFKKAVKALIFFQGKYLLLIRSKTDENFSLMWDFPGGSIELGESLTDGLKREVKEETGIDINASSAPPIKKWVYEKDGIRIDGTDFLCAITNQPEIKLSFEHSDFRWLTESEIINNETIPSWLKDTVRSAVKLFNVKS